MIGIHARMHNEIGWQSDQPENRDDGADFLPTAHNPFLLSNHDNNNHYNNRSGDKQSNSKTLISLAAIPDKEVLPQGS